jgi:hypothetical protein
MSNDPANPAPVRSGPHGGQGSVLRRGGHAACGCPISACACALSSRRRSCSAATTTSISSGLA